jgi:hypothetical protein
MKPQLVSAVAVLICCAIFAVVGVFGYSRYKAAQIKDAEFRAQLLNPGPGQPASLPTRMPEQLPPRSTTAAGNPTASPQPAQ